MPKRNALITDTQENGFMKKAWKTISKTGLRSVSQLILHIHGSLSLENS